MSPRPNSSQNHLHLVDSDVPAAVPLHLVQVQRHHDGRGRRGSSIASLDRHGVGQQGYSIGAAAAPWAQRWRGGGPAGFERHFFSFFLFGDNWLRSWLEH